VQCSFRPPLYADQLAAIDVPHHIAHDAAWGCRDKSDLINLLFLGLSTSFNTQLNSAVADGRCAYFAPGESVSIIESGERGLVRVHRGGAAPVSYWTPLRNLE
jgi:hypothetical protein